MPDEAPPTRPSGDPELIEEIVDKIAQARKPVILGALEQRGQGVRTWFGPSTKCALRKWWASTVSTPKRFAGLVFARMSGSNRRAAEYWRPLRHSGSSTCRLRVPERSSGQLRQAFAPCASRCPASLADLRQLDPPSQADRLERRRRKIPACRPTSALPGIRSSFFLGVGSKRACCVEAF